MSFSVNVKNELSRCISPARHCQIAEIAAIIGICGKVYISEIDRIRLSIQTENIAVARKYFTLLKKSFNINIDVSIRRNTLLKKSRIYKVSVNDDEAARKILLAVKFMNPYGEIEGNYGAINHMVIQNTCCKRAFFRGSFLAIGSISDPRKAYHFEMICTGKEKAAQLQNIMAAFNIEAKIILRKKYYVVYVKEGAQIVDILNIMGAHTSLMDLENIRILKEMRNSINRRVNCETANISKTVSAAVKQVEDITYIKNMIGFGRLSEGQKEIANLRLEYPEASLSELGRLLSIPVGKSGVNHRLRKLNAIADELREQETRNASKER